MTHAVSIYEREAVESIAQQYREKGFDVEIEPSAESLKQLPFNILQYKYRPDLIARKGNEGAIVEVKHKNKPTSISQLQKIAQTISQHENWRFLVTTLDDVDTEDELDKEIAQPWLVSLPSWDDLLAQQSEVFKLIETDNLAPALLYQWSVFEAALRQRAAFLSLPIQNCPVPKLLNHLYSLGEISILEFDIFQRYLKLRNKISHGFVQVINKAELLEFCELVQTLLRSWSEEAMAV